jgi:glycosyltransferase involved in cell wall biosynthesis
MTKYKILVLPSDRTGVSKFRSIDQHLKLQEKFGDEFWIDIDYNPKLDDDNYLKQYDLIHYHRTLHPDYNFSRQVIPRIKKLGIPAIMDLDDYWLPNPEHPAYMIIRNKKMDEQIVANLKLADYVTTTTSLFAKEIKKICKNVYVLPNSVDPKERQFKPNVEKSDRVRIGWLGGSSHLADLKILDGTVNKLLPIKDKLQFVLCGFDTRGSITEINPQTREERTRKIKPKESVWYEYEKIFTANYKIVDKPQLNDLMKFNFGEEYSDLDTPYRRVWTKPITTYASNYNKFDISLAPLKPHTFNMVKSQLKVIEAGFHKKALIAQDFGPYQIDGINAYERGGTFNSKGNSLLIDSSKNHKQWSQHIKRLVENPSLIEDLGERLYESVQKYHIDRVTEERAEIYKQIIKSH